MSCRPMLSEITRYPETRIFPAEFLRQYARHSAVSSADRRAVDLQGAGGACRDAVRQLRHLQRVRAAGARADTGQRGIPQLREIRAESARLESRPAISRPISAASTGLRRANTALLQTSNLRFAQIDDAEVIGFVKESVAGDNAVAVAVALTQAGTAGVLVSFRRHRDRSIDCAPARQAHRESRHRRASRARVGRGALAHRPAAGSCPVVPLLHVRVCRGHGG